MKEKKAKETLILKNLFVVEKQNSLRFRFRFYLRSLFTRKNKTFPSLKRVSNLIRNENMLALKSNYLKFGPIIEPACHRPLEKFEGPSIFYFFFSERIKECNQIACRKKKKVSSCQVG